jgi:hypothetical protein
MRELHGHVAEPTEANHANLLALGNAVVEASNEVALAAEYALVLYVLVMVSKSFD